MKKIFVVLVVMAMIALVSSVAMATVVGSKHDLSSTGSNSGTYSPDAKANGEICVFCHTPHAADANAPLWNRTLDSSGYTMYGATYGWTGPTGTTFTPTAAATAPNTKSLVCMSCHDGATGLGGAVINAPGPGTAPNGAITLGNGDVMASNTANLGKALGSTHPISIIYNPAVAGLRAITVVTNWPDAVVRVVGAGAVQSAAATNQYIECVSCHDPHNNGSAGTYSVQFLRIDNGGSALCVACHATR